MTAHPTRTAPRALRELDAVFRAVSTPLLLLQPDAPAFHIVGANQAFVDVVGIPSQDLVGRGYFQPFPFESDMRASLDRVLATRAPDVMPMRRDDVPLPGGAVRERIWSPTNIPILEADGRLTRIAHHLQDVTAIVQVTRDENATAARTRAESRIWRVFDKAPVAYAVLRGPEHRFEAANPNYLEMIGHRPVLGRPIREALPELAGAGFTDLLDCVLATGRAHNAREYHVRLDRANAPPDSIFTFVLEPLRGATDAVEGVAIIGVEVTELVMAREAAERVAMEHDIQRRQIQTVLEQAPIGVAVAEAPTGALVFLNRKVHEVFGHERGATTLEDYARNFRGYHLGGRSLASGDWAMARALTRGELVEGEVLEIERDDGSRRTIRINAAPVRDAEDRIIAGVVMLQDITAERRLEQQLEHAQRLQSVGTLAGGVAHEVNNALQVTLGFGTFVLQALGPSHPQAADVRVALQSAERAARVSQQLLAFARQQVTQPRALDLGALVAALHPVLQQLLGVDKLLVIPPAASPTVIHADPGQVQQVLINLIANARDASATGAEVSIVVDEVAILEPAVPPQGVTAARGHGAMVPGRYGRFAVTDHGSGMDAATLARIFEPFFTTKDVGEGTGLGLSMVYGIAKQHGGYVWARSAPGLTTFEVYWPVTTGPVASDPAADGTCRRRSGDAIHRVVLVAEDEPMVRALVARTLEAEGYHVVAAEDGQAALELLDSDTLRPDLLVTDVIMPRLNGRQLSDAVAARWPGLPVLYMSGHIDSDSVLQQLLPAGAPFLQKPFAPGSLARVVGELIGRTGARR
jgi:PAS domain S-box-containing protein